MGGCRHPPSQNSMDSIQQHLTSFHIRLREKLEQVTSDFRPQSVAQQLVDRSTGLTEVFSGLGNAAFDLVREAPKGMEDELLNAYVVNFHWSPLAKNFVLLWRESLFELKCSELMVQEGSMTEAEQAKFLQAVLDQLSESAEKLDSSIELKINDLKDRKRIGRRKVKSWRIQRNPWSLYQEQFAEIPLQCERINRELKDLYGVGETFSRIRDAVRIMMSDAHGHCTRIGGMVSDSWEMTRKLLDEDGEKSLGKIAAKLEDLEPGLEIPHLLDGFTVQLSELVDQLPENSTFPVGFDGGMVAIREVALQRRVQAWLKSELLPLIYEVWELTEAIRNESRMTFVNQRNYAILQANEVKDGRKSGFDPEGFAQLPEELGRRIGIYENSLSDLMEQIEGRVSGPFRLSVLFEAHAPFLPVALQSTIDQLRLNQNQVLTSIRTFTARQTKRVRGLIRTVEKEEALSDAEKVIRYLQEREADPMNSQYASIFLTKGFVSTSFVVGRKDELDHTENLIHNWRQGFRGSLLLTGSRFSGKTLLGELIAARHFEHNTIRLTPDSHFTVQGRKFETTHDLGAALELIQKYSLNSKYLIWIDDLESWWSRDHDCFEHAESLKRFLDIQASRTFVMVSVGNAMNWRLSRTADWLPSFQAEINLDRMETEEIREAILIRHSATHQKLLNDEGDEVSPQEFRRLTNAIAQSANGNIGEALNRWSFATRKREDNGVINVFNSRFSLPDVGNPDLAILLSSILMQRRTSEFQLRKLFGPAFPVRYAPLVRRMFSIGVLTRGLDGWLEVNPILVHDLGLALGSDRYIHYTR